MIKEYINKFPRCASDYIKEKAINRKYLNPELTLKEIYKLYLPFYFKEKLVNPVKESFYARIFNTHFNLSFDRLETDTYVMCDKLQLKIDHGNNKQKLKRNYLSTKQKLPD